MTSNLASLDGLYLKISVLEAVEKAKSAGLVWTQVNPVQFRSTLQQGDHIWDLYLTRNAGNGKITLDLRRSGRFFTSISSDDDAGIRQLYEQAEGTPEFNLDQLLLKDLGATPDSPNKRNIYRFVPSGGVGLAGHSQLPFSVHVGGGMRTGGTAPETYVEKFWGVMVGGKSGGFRLTQVLVYETMYGGAGLNGSGAQLNNVVVEPFGIRMGGAAVETFNPVPGGVKLRGSSQISHVELDKNWLSALAFDPVNEYIFAFTYHVPLLPDEPLMDGSVYGMRWRWRDNLGNQYVEPRSSFHKYDYSTFPAASVRKMLYSTSQSKIYVATINEVWVIPVSGGLPDWSAVSILASGFFAIYGMALDETNGYIYLMDNDQIKRMAFAGTGLTNVTTPTDMKRTGIFIRDNGGNKELWGYKLDDGPSTISTDTPFGYYTHLYRIDLSDSSSVSYELNGSGWISGMRPRPTLANNQTMSVGNGAGHGRYVPTLLYDQDADEIYHEFPIHDDDELPGYIGRTSVAAVIAGSPYGTTLIDTDLNGAEDGYHRHTCDPILIDGTNLWYGLPYLPFYISLGFNPLYGIVNKTVS